MGRPLALQLKALDDEAAAAAVKATAIGKAGKEGVDQDHSEPLDSKSLDGPENSCRHTPSFSSSSSFDCTGTARDEENMRCGADWESNLEMAHGDEYGALLSSSGVRVDGGAR